MDRPAKTGYAQAEMVPVSFGRCFGWLHPAAGQKAVVLCGALGYEGLCAHQTWRVLAAGIAEAGLPVLRFDYDGTGDSLGDDEDGERLAAWRGSIIEAVAWLRANLEVSKVALVGLRLGAGLALEAAADIDGVDELVLIAPSVSGKTHVREMRARAALIASELRFDRSRDAASQPFHVAGFSLTSDTIAALKQFDALAVSCRPARRALVLAEPGNSACERIVARLEALGCETTSDSFAGYASIMAPPTAPREQSVEIERVVAWLDAESESTSNARPVRIRPAELATPVYSEQAIFFGRNDGLVGILCEPNSRRQGRPCVLFVNGGANPHIGWARSSVLHARQLAALGIASLRMDFGGIGDSYATSEGPRAALYREARFDDLRAALDRLEAAGFAGFTVVGSCSGAHAAFHAAALDARIAQAILINLQCFGVPRDGQLEVVMRSGHRSMHSFWNSLLQPRSWKRILSGDIGAGRILSIARSMTRRAARRFRGNVLAPMARLFGRVGDVERKFRLMSARGQRLLLVYSEDDGGRDELAAHMGPRGRRATRLEGVGLQIIAAADHDLTQRWARERLFDLMREHLRLGDRQSEAAADFRAEKATAPRAGRFGAPAAPGERALERR